MQKRERLEKTIAGEKADRIPVALWRHFPGDDQRPMDLAQAAAAFQEDWDFDFVVVSPANTYSVIDYGLQDRWAGALDGTREITRREVIRSLDWTELRRLEPTRGTTGQQIETLNLLNNAFGEDVPFLLTVHSPLAQAGMLAGSETLIHNMRTHPDRLKTGLNTITDNTLRFIDAIRKTGIAGILYVIDHAAYAIMNENEYREFGCSFDMQIMRVLPQHWWLNMMQISGKSPMLKAVADYPVQVLSWNDREGFTDLAEGKLIFKGAVCGGLGRWKPMHDGMPGEVREQARDAVEQVYGRRLILSTGLPLIITSPRSNIRMARQIVEEFVR